MRFEDEFCNWIDECLSGEIPTSVKAFSFNLWQPAGVHGVKFAVNLIGAGEFDKSDPYWPCDEVWEAPVRGIPIPTPYSTESWEICLQKIRSLVLRKLKTTSNAVARLKSCEGVGIGFIDGDLEVLWMRES